MTRIEYENLAAKAKRVPIREVFSCQMIFAKNPLCEGLAQFVAKNAAFYVVLGIHIRNWLANLTKLQTIRLPEGAD
jgi:hypothetical protein